jgi:mycofactocin glycosyltransferase
VVVVSRRFALDPSYRRVADDVVIAGSPLRLFRLTPAGRVVADALERDGALAPGHAALTDRLIDAGAIHPSPDVTDCGPVTVVVPAWRQTPPIAVGRAVAEMVVVDDASPQRIEMPTPVRVLHLARNVGPATARNTGLATVTTALVAFVDSDVELPDGWLEPLLAHFADPRVALVAPRVRTAPGGSTAVDGVEALSGSLDLGAAPARVAPGSRVSYVPAAALVCRTEAVRAVGGFDERLRRGEDVDLVWRLGEAGWRCRYEPAVVVDHRARSTVGAWLRQQFGYGTSAAPLAARHPGALAPLRVSGWSLAAWALVAARRPLAGAALTVVTGVFLQRKLRGVPPAVTAGLAGTGTLAAGEQIASAISRTWWPLAAVALGWRPARPVVAAAVAVPRVLAVWRGRPTRPARVAAMHLLGDLAYGAGVWCGAIRARSFAALVPDLANWPPRARPVAP